MKKRTFYLLLVLCTTVFSNFTLTTVQAAEIMDPSIRSSPNTTEELPLFEPNLLLPKQEIKEAIPKLNVTRAGIASRAVIPTQPIVDPIYPDTRIITGKTSPNVWVFLTTPGKAVARVASDHDGNFSYSLLNWYSVGTNFYVYSSYNYNGSHPSATIVATVVARPIPAAPNQPTIEPVYNDSTTITGLADSNTEVFVTIGGEQYTTTANNERQYTITLNKTYATGTQISAYSRSNGLNSTIAQGTVLKNVALILMPTINEVTEDTLIINGNTTPNVTIQLTIGNDIYHAVSNQNGDFTIQLDHTYYRGTLINVYASDTMGNKSEVFVASVQIGEIILGVDYLTTNDTVLVGQTIPGSMNIRVVIGNRVYLGATNNLGYFNIPLSRTYPAGTNIFVTATDPSTGKTVQKSALIYPAPPTIHQVLVGADRISGTADPNAAIYLTIAGREYSGYTNAAGYYSLNVSPLDTFKGSRVAVYQVSNAMTSLLSDMLIE